MLEAFRDHLERSGLVPPGVSVLVGYSGGPDSTALLHLLKRAGVDVVAAHLEHGQRPEGAKEHALAEAFATSLEVPFVGGKADVPQIASFRGKGLEEAGRAARYEFFRKAASSVGCPLIATGHTLDDHLETIFLHLARGAGYAGAAGIPERRGELIRPLLPFSRAQTRSYCEGLGLWFHDDPTNVDERFARARVRARLLPEFRALHPGAEEALLRFSRLADEESRFLDGAAANALERAEIILNGDLNFLTSDVELAFDREMLVVLPPVLARRAIRLAVSFLGEALDFEQTHLVAESLKWEAKGAVTADGGELVLEWDSQKLHVRKLEVHEPFRYPLVTPGETESEVFGWRLTARASEASQRPTRAALVTELDRSKVKGDLFFRGAQEGDRMIPLGFDQERKLADLIAESKLTLAARRRLPIICDMLGPIWIPGVCLAERVRPASESAAVWRLEFGPWVPRETKHPREA